MTSPKTTTRQTKTPAQRAEEAVTVLRRRIDRLVEKRAAAKVALDQIDTELDGNRRRLDYALQSPDLPTQPQHDTTTAPEETA